MWIGLINQKLLSKVRGVISLLFAVLSFVRGLERKITKMGHDMLLLFWRFCCFGAGN
jgi:hypothetical protein